MMPQHSFQANYQKSLVSPRRYWLRSLVERPARLRWYFHWRSSLDTTKMPLGDHIPWITFDAIDWMRSFLKPEMSVFEWGSGSSTLFWSDSVSSVVAIEHDPEWHRIVAEKLTALKKNNVALRLVQPDEPSSSDILFVSNDERFLGLSFERYVRAIDSFQDESFDLIVVDGRVRVNCVELARSKVRKGGCLLLDNSDRPKYADAFKLLEDWPRKDFFGLVPFHPNIICAVSVWRRPYEDAKD